MKKKSFTVSYILKNTQPTKNSSDLEEFDFSYLSKKKISKQRKDIRKLNNQNKPSEKIERFINPISLHWLPGDIILVDYSSEEYIPDIYNFNYFKTIKKLDINTDMGLWVYEFHDSLKQFSNPQLIISRLDSLGDTEAHQLSEKIKSYCQCIKSAPFLKNNNVNNDIFFSKLFESQNKKIIQENINFPVIMIHFKSEDNEMIKITQIGFNKKFLEFIYGDNEILDEKLQSYSIPNYVLIKKSNYYGFMNAVLSSSLMDDNQNINFIATFLTDQGFEIDISLTVIKNSFETDKQKEIFKLVRLELDETKINELNSKRFMFSNKKKKNTNNYCNDWKELIEKYYGNKKITKNEEEIDDKRCKFKML